MARPLDERQQAELSAFVNALAERAGYTTTAEWARDSGYPAPNLSNLRNQHGAIDGYNLLRLVRAAAERVGITATDLALEVAGAGEADRDIFVRRLAGVEGGLLELARLVRESLEAEEASGSPTAHDEIRSEDRSAKDHAT